MIKILLLSGLIITYLPKCKFNYFIKIGKLNKSSIIFFESLLIWTVILIEFILFNPEDNFLTIVGLAIFFFGVMLITVSRFQLKENYLPALIASPSVKITTNGFYKYVRHPIYLGVLLAVIGFEIILYPILVMIILILIPLIISQINKEEKMLFKNNEMKWGEYTNSTPFKLIPFVY